MIEITHLNYRYKEQLIFSNLKITLKKGELVTLLAPSGTGKSTLLDILTGKLKITDSLGKISFDGVKTSFKDWHKKQNVFSLAPQTPLLLPWKSVEENLMFCALSYYEKKEAQKQVMAYLDIIHLKKDANKRPNELSLGMKQRVSFAMACLINRPCLLLDEPFSALDYYTRQALTKYLKDFISKKKKYSLLVTHDIQEAVLFSNKIYLINPNKRNDVQIFITKNKGQKELILEVIEALKT